MAVINYRDYLSILTAIKQAPQSNVWLSYDAGADVLYINFQESGYASDSELTDDDVIIRYDGDEVIGITVLHASRR